MILSHRSWSRSGSVNNNGGESAQPSTSSSLHGLLFIQRPPRATPPATVQPFLHGHPSTIYCSSSPPHHGVLFIHPSTGTPPPSTVHPALHTMGSCSSTPPRAPSTIYCSSSPPPHHGVMFIQRQRHRSLFIQPPATLTVHPIDRLQLAAVAKESLDRVQLTAIDRSLGFSNA